MFLYVVLFIRTYVLICEYCKFSKEGLIDMLFGTNQNVMCTTSLYTEDQYNFLTTTEVALLPLINAIVASWK